MMKQQFCSMLKPMTTQTSFWLLANGSANSIPGEPGFWLDYIRISTKNPGTKHSGVFHLVQRQREPVSLKTTNVGGPEDGKSVVKTLMVKFRSIKAFSLIWVIHEECFNTHTGLSVLKCLASVTVAYQSPKLRAGVRLPGGTPCNLGCWYSWEHNALARHSHRFDPGTVHQIL